MIDLTGANLVAYLMRVVKDAVIRNPRFRNTLGEVTFASNNQIFWGDAQVTIKSITTNGTRLSPDYFMCTQHGRAILAKVGDKEGAFVEWVVENDKTRTTPAAGVYYFNVDAVNEQTRDVNLTVQQYRWASGNLTNAEGTKIALRSGLDGTTLTPYDVTSPATIISAQAYQPFIYLLSPVKQLGLKQGSTDLVPNVDFWIERKQTVVIINSTAGGSQTISVPSNMQSFDVVDQDGYVLRRGIDYYPLSIVHPHTYGFGLSFGYNFGIAPVTYNATVGATTFITVSQYTPPAQTLSVVGVFRLDPSVTIPATNPENVIQVAVGPNEKLAAGEVFISTPAGDFNTAQPDSTGNITLPTLLLPGDWLRWEARVQSSTFTVVGKKYELNGFKKTVWDPKAGAVDANTPAPGGYVVYLDPATQQPVNPLPGMLLAIGDSVVVGDQCAVIVNPDLTETYEVFGSKENLTFTLECKANDYQTASDISELLKRELLIMRRENMEADGITIFEATRDNQGEQRDMSGTAPRYIFNVSVTASADWKVFVPCVTRLVSYEVNDSTYTDGYAGKLSMAPRLQALGAFQFIPSYA